MKRILLSLILTLLMLVDLATPVLALEDPRSKPNNKIGIHILFDSELGDVAKLVNSNGGDWGYVIIPIQSGDKDLIKWQKFMDEASRLHLIPIIRLATEGDYFNTKVWRRPDESDILDFANFLNSLTWPTENRYVVVFNEVNRGDEWGGAADPTGYAQLLSYAVTVFKSLNPHFFIVSGGLDNAAPNQGSEYIDQYSFMRQMNAAVPGIFYQVDGVASHSYPNPGFSQPPSVHTSKSIASFMYERELLRQMTSKKLPIFITETGWSLDRVSDEARANYYNEALKGVWADPDIVAITPFILHAAGPFAQFSFIREDGKETPQYSALKNIAKTKGAPTVTVRVLGASNESEPVREMRSFKEREKKQLGMSLSQALQAGFKWIMKL